MKKKFKIGFLPLTKANWTNDVMEAQRAKAREMLQAIPDVEVVGGEAMIDVEPKAMREYEIFERERPDIIVAFYATFALGVIVPRFAKNLKTPVILWSIPEPDPAGGRLQANSFCATNMNAHFLWRFHVPYFHVHGAIDSAEAQKGLERAVRIARAADTVSKMRIGVIGGRVPGFYTSCCSEMLLRDKIGPEVKYITMLEVVNAAKNMPEERVVEALKIIESDTCCAPTASAGDVRKSAALFAAIAEMKEKFLVDNFTLRCWPEVISEDLYGITACSTIGHLNNHGLLTVCEGDVYAAVMLRLEKELSGQDPFFCDMIVCEGDHAVLCTAARLRALCARRASRANSQTAPTVVKCGVTHEFPLKAGRITLGASGRNARRQPFQNVHRNGHGA